MKVHFVGIGGIGVSALAQYYLALGHGVSGSDLVSSEITNLLKKKGAKIFIGKHRAENIPKGVDLVVYSPAVPETNPELNNKLATLSYPEALGELTRRHFTIAISGTLGKSTTASMIGLILIRAGFDPTVILGTKLKEFGNSNFRMGKSKYLVIEADEHFASFLNYRPRVIVLTNIEKDHLDYYKNYQNLLKAFQKYVNYLPPNGILVKNTSLDNIIFTAVKNVLSFSLKQEETEKLRKILKIPGEHNILNALAALTLARALKIPDQTSFSALADYRGCWRRFEEKKWRIKDRVFQVISDYAHHPTEIKATIAAAKEKYPSKKILAVFQPHQYQRTFYLFKDFVKAFDEADRIIICDIYDVAGLEKKKISRKVSSEKLAKAIKGRGKDAKYIGNFKKISDFLEKETHPANLILLIIGAGDIYSILDKTDKMC
jgi:UDP-N-acetylmuramate--alanine ligase